MREAFCSPSLFDGFAFVHLLNLTGGLSRPCKTDGRAFVHFVIIGRKGFCPYPINIIQLNHLRFI